MAWTLAVAVIGIAGYLAIHPLVGRHARKLPSVSLPASPRGWLDAYEGAAIDNPQQVCSRLFSPALAAAYGRSIHSTCTDYFTRISSSSVTVRRILRDGWTAVLELHQTADHSDWAVVLDHRPGGWQAVDLLDGRLLR